MARGRHAGSSVQRAAGRYNRRWPFTAPNPSTARETPTLSKTGVGGRLPRKEDDRFLRGRGQYIGDIRFPGMREVAFVRSPVAHARLIDIRIPDHLRSSVFTAADLAGVRPIRAVSSLPGFQASEQPPLATDKVRHVGELIAMCVADTRAEAEDLAAEVVVEYEDLPAVVDMLAAQAPGCALVHDAVKRNIYLEVGFDGPIEAIAKTAPVKVTRELRTARQVMSPIECRGFIAQWDARLSQLIVHGATQFPHVVRTGLSQVLRLPEIQIRVVSPDVGGGFGYKAILAGEEVCLCWLAMRCGYPVRWLEDRREQLTANANCREHHYLMSAYADETGRILAFEAKAAVDSGAYSAYPFTSAIEPSQVSAILPGPYVIPAYRCKTAAVVTNKCPQLPYRGVARPVFSEQTAHGTTADGKRRALYEQAFARLTPDGRLDVRVGIQSIGQGLETTLAQIASQYLGIDPSDVHVRLGDTEISPYSSGAWGSRGIVWAGGATARACKELADRVASIGAALLQTDVTSVDVRDGGVFGPRGSVSLADIARAFYLAPADLPDDIDPHGLEVTAGYAPKRLTGVHTGSVHATVVAVDPETGGVEILDYVVVEDAGTLVNPMIVDGQIQGGTAQGIGSALFEEMPFDRQGQPLATTLADYLLPGCPEVPHIRILHMATPSPYTELGQKGVGESGAIGPAAAIASAINDALQPFGVELCELPITPPRILAALS